MVTVDDEVKVGCKDAYTFSDFSLIRPSDWKDMAERTERKYDFARFHQNTSLAFSSRG
jgi:hypothetical protein